MQSRGPKAEPAPLHPAAAIETSRRPGSAALALETGEMLLAELPAGGDQAAQLFAALESLTGRAGIAPGAIALVVVGLGPGSFTGLRAGAAAAATLASFLPARLVALPSCAGTPLAREGGWRAICLDALRGQVQGAIYEDGMERQPPLLAKPEAFGRLLAGRIGPAGEEPGLVGGDGVELLERAGALPPTWRKAAAPDCWVPRADLLLREGVQLARRGGSRPPEGLEPLYLRPSAAEEGRP